MWILLGAAAVIGLIAWTVHAARKRSRIASDWHSKVMDAYAEGAALHDAVGVAGTSGLEGAAADLRWSEIQRRADGLTETLYRLREAAPTEQDRAHVADVIAALQAIQSQIASEHAPNACYRPSAGTIYSRLRTFDYALSALRDPGEHRP